MSDPSKTPRWYLIQTKPRQGQRAETNLQNQGFTVYYPMLEIERVRKGQRILVPEALFPNYIFIQLCRWTDNWHPLRSTRGVSRLVGFGEEPAIVPDEIIADIQQRLGQTEPQAYLKSGDRVRITKGIFRGFDAIFQTYDGESRVILLLEFLQKQTRLTAPITDIERLD